jgi:hypothetical protein
MIADVLAESPELLGDSAFFGGTLLVFNRSPQNGKNDFGQANRWLSVEWLKVIRLSGKCRVKFGTIS